MLDSETRKLISVIIETAKRATAAERKDGTSPSSGLATHTADEVATDPGRWSSNFSNMQRNTAVGSSSCYMSSEPARTALALMHYEIFYDLPKRSVCEATVAASSASIDGWAAAAVDSDAVTAWLAIQDGDFPSKRAKRAKTGADKAAVGTEIRSAAASTVTTSLGNLIITDYEDEVSISPRATPRQKVGDMEEEAALAAAILESARFAGKLVDIESMRVSESLALCESRAPCEEADSWILVAAESAAEGVHTR